MTDAIDRARQLPPLTVRDITRELDNPTDSIRRCVDPTTGDYRKPHELYIHALHTWLLCDGSRTMTALQGTITYKGLARDRLASAVKRWERKR